MKFHLMITMSQISSSNSCIVAQLIMTSHGAVTYYHSYFTFQETCVVG